MKHKTIAVDVAKTVFEVGVSERPGRVKEGHRLTARKLMRFMATQQESTVVMEACGMAHHWGRQFQQLGHEVVLLPPAYVKPYVRRNKTDRADVKGMLEAYRNEEIAPVPVKTLSQHQLAALHRIRQGWMRTRTARINAMRGILREIGLSIPMGASRAVERVQCLIEDAGIEIAETVRALLHEVCQEVTDLQRRIKELECRLRDISRQQAKIEQMQSIPGIGLLMSTAISGFVGDLNRFRSGRHLASYLGLTPREYSSGHRRRLGSISKQGNVYLRTLLIHGGRAVLRSAKTKKRHDRLHRWALKIEARRGHNKAAVAVANKLARRLWAISTRDTVYVA